MMNAVLCKVFVTLCATMPWTLFGSAETDFPLVTPSLGKQVEIILTFDDGPHAARTPVVLDLLDQYGYKAIFFVVGERYSEHKDKEPAKEVLREILRRGHLIGNHTMHHDMGLCTRSLDTVKQEIAGNHLLIHEMTGTVPLLFRPPGGIDCPVVRDTVKAAGETILFWDIDSLDWKWKNRYATLEKLKQGVYAVQHRPFPHVVLLHDIHEESVEALKLFLKWIQQEPHVSVIAPERWVEIHWDHTSKGA